MGANLQRALAEYKASHRHPVNVWIHRVCVPLIVVSLMGILKAIPGRIDWSWVLVVAGLIYISQFRSARLFAAFLLFFLLVEKLLNFMIYPFWPSFGIFVLAWAGQFVGHYVEGKQPAFMENLASFVLGPVWVMKSIVGE